MQVECDECGKRYAPTKEQKAFIARSRKKGMHFIMLECPLCGLSASFDPTLGKVDDERVEREPADRRKTYVRG